MTTRATTAGTTPTPSGIASTDIGCRNKFIGNPEKYLNPEGGRVGTELPPLPVSGTVRLDPGTGRAVSQRRARLRRSRIEGRA